MSLKAKIEQALGIAIRLRAGAPGSLRVLVIGEQIFSKKEAGHSPDPAEIIQSIRAKATRLVTTGLYSRLRNPIYTFGCFFFLGLAMFIPEWWVLLALVIVIPMQVVRSRREAAVLEATFGDEYRRYRQQTWF